MTIPEAAQLVIQAGAMGNGGEVFVLDMGEPVRIVELAENLIRLSGLIPGKDIPIVFTGVRAGEKLFEELLSAEEGASATRHERIFIATIQNGLNPGLLKLLDKFEHEGQVTPANIRSLFKELISDYHEAKIDILQDEAAAAGEESEEQA
jgi:FlaA1/EpsC-like NDP-sugar epimerase